MRGEEDFVAAHAVKVNVFHTIDYLLKHSKAIRDGVKSGQIEIQGAVYDLSTGVVDFMGRSTRQAELLESEISMPPTVLKVSKAGAALRGVYGVRTGADDSMAPGDALDKLKEGNDRYVRGEPQASAVNSPMRKALVKSGQAPHTAVIGCADSRAPIETLFDCMPGEIFVLRNAGNTATHAEGSLVGSLEFCTGKLGSRLVLVLGHTQCGAIVGATKTFLDGKKETAAGSALEGLLKDLSEVAAQASESLGKGASVDELAAHAVKVNVFHTMSFLLKYSEPLRELVRSGQVDLQGGIYHLETGRVEFLGHAPDHKELLAAKTSLPPSMEGIAQGKVRTAADEPMKPEAAMKLLKDGNDRFCHGKPMAGKLDSQMRKALATAGQAPHTAIVGCADSRVPLELVFDVLPGDLFVMRNAGNTITHARGSVVGSLEFCVSALRTQMVVVLGHTACGAIKGATGAYLKGTKPEEAKGALEGLLVELGKVAANAAKELGSNASEKEIADHAVKVNVFNTIDNLIKGSSTIRDKVKNGTVDIQGGIYDLDTGRVQWLGRSPNQAALL
ncbi:mtcA2 [Symbiodinium natans]|uniref:carbonic anhydrase n=1 Tax=Symbiodinium natans TaxID=878477 RepID=A0A812NSB2_9DINO|nr:mtcA2 [Symbiodinium natans]